MSDYDVNEHFRQVLGQNNDPQAAASPWDALAFGQSKHQSIMEAEQRKVNELRLKHEQFKQTLVGKLGLDPKGIAGRTTNLGASAFASTMEAAGDLMALPFNLEAMGTDFHVPDEVKGAYARYQAGQANERDMALLNQVTEHDLKGREEDGYVPTEQDLASPANRSFLGRLERSEKSRMIADSISDAADYRGLIDNRFREELSNQLRTEGAEGIATVRSANEKVKQGDYVGAAKDYAIGLADLAVQGGEAFLTNPQAFLEHTSEMIPDLAIGLVSRPAMVARNVGYGIETYREGVEKYRAEHNGELPPEDQQRWMAANAFGSALMEVVGDATILKNLEGATGGVRGAARKVSANTFTEGTTEGAQTYMEGEAGYAPASAEDIYEGVVIGGGVGTTVSAAEPVVKGIKTGTKTITDRASNAVENVVEKADLQKKARETGDVSTLIDPKNKAYDPVTAAKAMLRRSQDDSLTDADRAASQEKLNRVISATNNQAEELKMQLDKTGPEAVAKAEARLAAFKSRLEATTDDVTRTELTDMIQLVEDDLAAAQAMSDKDRKALEKRYEKAQKFADQVNKIGDYIQKKSQPTQDEIESLFTSLESPDTDEATAQESADRLITLAMENPGSLDMERVRTLADLKGNRLTAKQQSFFRALSDAEVSANLLKDLDGVNNEVLVGSGRYPGLQEYNTKFNRAIRGNNPKAADGIIDMVSTFATQRLNKFNTVNEAYEQAKATGEEFQVVADPDGGFSIKPANTLDEKALRENGGLNIHKNSGNLVQKLEAERDAVIAANEAMLQTRELKFGKSELDQEIDASVEATAAQASAGTAPETTPEAPVATAEVKSSESTSEAGTEQVAPVVEPVTETAEVEESGTQDEAPQTETTSTAPEADEAKPVQGGLRALAGMNKETREAERQKPTEAKDIKTPVMNRVKAFFIQRRGSGKDRKPLATLQNFLSRTDDASVVEQFEPDTVDLTTEEGQVLKGQQESLFLLFKTKAKAWAPQINLNLAAISGLQGLKDRQRDMAMYLTVQPENTEANRKLREAMAKRAFDHELSPNKKGTKAEKQAKAQEAYNFVMKAPRIFEENVTTAISYAAFNYVATEANGSAFNDDAAMKAMLGLEDHHTLPWSARQALRRAGTARPLVVDSLGSAAMSALGLEAADKQTPASDIAKLRTSLGNHVLGLLASEGLVEQVEVPGDVFTEAAMLNDVKVAEEFKDSNGKHFYIRFKRQPDIADGKVGDLMPVAQSIVETNKGTQGYLSKLFGAESDKKYPSLKPIEMIQEFAKNTKRTLSKFQQKVTEKVGKEPHYLRQDVLKVHEAMSPELREIFAGVQDATAPGLHVEARESMEAKNEALRRELTYLEEFVSHLRNGKGLGHPFYFGRSVWKVFRAGLDSNTINPQTSKIHRHLIQMQGWESEVKLDNDESVAEFLLAVADGLGIDTDKQLNDLSVMDVLEKLESDEIQAAVQAIDKTLDGIELDQPDLNALASLKKPSYHMLEALTEYAKYQRAKGEGAKTLKTSIMREVDGVTNGPMMLFLQMGAMGDPEAFSALLNRGGFYREGEAAHYTDWRSTGSNEDLYQSFAKNVVQAVGRTLKAKPDLMPVYQAAAYFMGRFVDPETGKVESAGRNAVKTPITGFAFGSSISTAVKNMTDKVYESYQDKLKEAFDNNDATALRTAIENMNRLIGNQTKGKPAFLDPEMSFDTALSTRLSPKQLSQLQDGFYNSLGQDVKKVMEDTFADLIDLRDSLNKSAKTAFEVYDKAYSHVRDQYIKQLVADGKLRVNDKGTVLDDLSAEQEAEVRAIVKDVEPVVHTSMSQMDDDIGSGILMAKSERRTKRDVQYRTITRFSSPIIETVNAVTGATNTFAQATVAPMVRSDTDPGVATVVSNLHAIDSHISQSNYGQRPALNVHDANGAGLNSIKQSAQTLNQATFQINAQYSLPVQIVEGLDRTLDAYTKLRQTYPDLEPVTVNTLHTRKAALEATVRKLEAMQKLTVVDQYAMEGGSYQVTDVDRKMVASELALVKAELAGVAAKIEHQLVAAKAATPETTAEANAAQARVDAQPAQQTATIESLNTALSEATTGSDLVRRIGRMIPVHLRPLARALAGNPVMKQLPVGFTVNDPEVAADAARNIGQFTRPQNNDYSKARALFNFDLLASSRYADQVATYGPVTVLHELSHAATAPALEATPVAGYESIPNKDYYKQDVATQAHMLLNHVKKWVQANPGKLNEAEKQMMSLATQDVSELVAYGSTDPVVQQVLRRVPAITKRKSAFDSLIELMLKAMGLKETHYSAMRDVLLLGARASAVTGRTLNRASQAGNADTLVTNPMTAIIEDFDSQSVFERLSQNQTDLGPDFREHLSTVLGTLEQTVQGPFGVWLKEELQNSGRTADDVFLNSIRDGKPPFASDVLAQNFRIGHAEAFVLEQVHASMITALDGNAEAYHELRKLFNEAKAQITPATFHSGNWATATAAEKKAARDKWNFVFELEADQSGLTNGYARFAAMGLAYKPMQQAVADMTTTVDNRSLRDMSFGEALQTLFMRALQVLAGKLTQTYAGQKGGAKLKALVKQLASIEMRHRQRLVRQEQSSLQRLEDAFNEKGAALREAVSKAARSKFVRENRSKLVQGIGGAISVVSGDLGEQFVANIEKIRNNAFDDRMGFIYSAINEVRGRFDGNRVFRNLLNLARRNEQQRKKVIESTTKLVRKAFGDNWANYDRDTKQALTRVLLKADLSSLMDNRSMSEIAALVTQPGTRKQTIDRLVQRLDSTYKAFYLHQIKDLGLLLATGETSSQNEIQALNAHNIAYLTGTQNFGQVTDAQAEKMIPIIDQLASLYALEYMPDAVMRKAQDAIQEQLARGEDNGVEQVLQLHRHQKAEAKERLFNGQDVHFMKGYTREIYDPFRELATANAAQGAELEAAGWRKVADLKKDPADQGEAKALYLIRDGGLKSRLTGIVSFTGEGTKGNTVHGGVTKVDSDLLHRKNGRENQRILKAKARNIQKMFKTPDSYDPRNHVASRMVPVYNQAGEIVNWRYLMNEDTKDTLLDRNNQIDDVLGMMAGSVLDKQLSADQNRLAVQALKDQYDEEFTEKPEAYLEVSAASKDPEIRETWRLLPDEMKKDIQRIWGDNKMFVRADLYELNFAYRKYSLADSFTKDRDARNGFEKVFTWMMEAFFGQKAALRVRQGEGIWQDIVKMVKDNVVIKNFFTLAGNIMSNITQLMWMGVPINKIVTGHITAIKGILRYQRDERRLTELQTKIKAGIEPGKVNEYQQEMVQLQDALARNPVKELLDAGLFQTIAEDVDTEDNPYTYTGRASRWIEEKTSFMGSGAQTVAKNVFMAHGTPFYTLLNQATQLSDFVARYTLHEHQTTRARNPLSKAESLEVAEEVFINYDVPTHKGLQYLNDSGLMMFTKYYMRIQKTILHLYRQNPGRALLLITLDNMLGGIPSLMDAQFFNRLGNNPFSAGAFNLPQSVGEIVPIKLMMSPFN